MWLNILKENAVTSDELDCLSVPSVNVHLQFMGQDIHFEFKNPAMVWLSNFNTDRIVITD